MPSVINSSARSAPVKAARKDLVVGVGDMRATNDAQATLVTYSLGSCIGVAIYDPDARVGGLLHAMLPDSTINPARAARQPFMFIDSGVPALFRAVYALGGLKHRLVVKIAGGAQFLDEKRVFKIGQRNSDAVLALLERNGVTPASAEIGGHECRTLRLELATGNLILNVPARNSRSL